LIKIIIQKAFERYYLDKNKSVICDSQLWVNSFTIVVASFPWYGHHKCDWVISPKANHKYSHKDILIGLSNTGIFSCRGGGVDEHDRILTAD